MWRSFLRVAGYFLVLVGTLVPAQAQSPFTIRRPTDGSTVREKVQIQIPRASIRPGGFVGFYIDGKFLMAVAPTEENSASGVFTYVWDTKANGIEDGKHTIRAVLFEPTANSGDQVAVSEKATSELQLNVANKIKDGPRSLTLRYKYREGNNLSYSRNSRSIIVGGVNALGPTTADQEINAVRSKLLLDIQDSKSDKALIRNKMTDLALIQGTQEVNVDPRQLSVSMYQELDTRGRVLYETGGATGIEYTILGLPINNTLELPELPANTISIGQVWRTPGQRLDIPGLPPVLQPRVTLENKLEGLEWEGNYKTAHIKQTWSGEIPVPGTEKMLPFGNIVVKNPRAKFERDIYIAYTSGTLVRVNRSLTIEGTTTDIAAPAAPAGGGGINQPPGPAGGGFPGAPGGSGPPPFARGAGGRGGRFPGRPGGSPAPAGEGGDSPAPRAPGGRGIPGPPTGIPGRPAAPGVSTGGAGGVGGVGGNNPEQPVTLRSTTETQLLKVTS